MKGYKFSFLFTEYKPVMETTYVGCKRCLNTWHEMYTHYSEGRINSAMMIYDACEKCITDAEKIHHEQAAQDLIKKLGLETTSPEEKDHE